MSSSMGAAMCNPLFSAAQDNNALWSQTSSSSYSGGYGGGGGYARSRPSASSVVYDGAFNESYIACSRTAEFLEVVPHVGRDRAGRTYVGLEVVSERDGKPRDDTPLDVVYCVDVSGSMSSRLGGGRNSKVEAAKRFCVTLTGALRADDRVAVVSFGNDAQVVLAPCNVQGCDMAEAVKALTAGGSTNLTAGMECAYGIAKSMKKPGRACRVVMLTDMCASEVESGQDVIRRVTVEGADVHGIGVTYVGLGEDFNQALTERVTVSSGSNYFSITSEEDFEARVQNQIASVFFPLVKEMQISITSKTHRVAGIFGSGKEGRTEVQDPLGWTRERAALYVDDKTAAVVESLKASGLNSDLVGVIVDQCTSGSAKPVVLFKERSVFAAPVSDLPGHQRGGWVLIQLDPVEASASGGSALFDLQYQRLDGSFGRVVKLVELGTVPADDKGMNLALVIKQYVDEIKETLSDENRYEVSAEFKSWWVEQVKQFPLTKQAENLDNLEKMLAKLKPAAPAKVAAPEPWIGQTEMAPPAAATPQKGWFGWLWNK